MRNNRNFIGLILICLFILDMEGSHAKDNHDDVCTRGAVKGINVDNVSGVYKNPINTKFADGSEYKSEDILEIVKYNKGSAYIRLSLRFYNAHSCQFSGIAEASEGALVHRGPVLGNSEECVLELDLSSNEIIIKATEQCHAYCGARGSFNHVKFEKNKKRTIRYMDRLRDSPQYISAVKAYEENRESCE